MAIPAIGAGVRAVQAANKLRKLKKPKKPKKKDTEEMEGALKDFQKMGNAEKAAVASVPATGAALTARKRDNKKLQENIDEELSQGLKKGGLARGKRKIAKGCGKVMGNRRKKTLYT